ncbi:hypothetical protein GGX14DRAFT_554877 [Mycena pura]|uniref:Uncharacterized protein n=1 Tax=Mycena pura TaxID=153505 RepID=A0AAD6YTG2_9AGAR|nr:hypothetical protein GGX14DRAFT_554877 [Mycena pura]
MALATMALAAKTMARLPTLPSTPAPSRIYRFPHMTVRRYASKPKTPIGEWYSGILPAMFPIALLGSAVYTGLLYAQLSLSHEKTMEEQATRLKELEAEVDAIR